MNASSFNKNQRVFSETEKNLGLGLILSINKENQTVEVNFPLAEETRCYSLRTHPLRRALFRKGQSFQLAGKTYRISHVSLENELAQYSCLGGEKFSEDELPASLVEEASPVEELLQQALSPAKSYDLRKEALELKKHFTRDRLSGLVTSRVNLLPHQVYLAHRVTAEENPRVLLADEVGLGKTIEAGLIYSCLNAIDKASRVLIITPESLVHQWAQEFSEAFESLFSVLTKDRYEQEDGATPLNPFSANPLVITSIESLRDDPVKAEGAAETPWDLVIVDEAHHLQWEPEGASPAWNLVNAISQQSKSLLLLTATPRHRGLTTQYGLLHMVDPKKFSNFEDFVVEMEMLDQIAACAKEISEAKNIPKSTKKQLTLLFEGDTELLEALEQEGENLYEEILDKLIDRYGTGRLIYRNRKCNLDYFPVRQVHLEALEAKKSYLNTLKNTNPEDITTKELMDYATGRKLLPIEAQHSPKDDPRAEWLARFIKKHPQEKIFVICSSKARVLEVGRHVSEILGLSEEESSQFFTLFHEDKSLLTRDKEASAFASTSSPSRVLIASELGGEGRNFQFLQHMVLFDLPTTPEFLEQRIGRLDRIGQKNTIHIHIPYLKGSPEEVFVHWYHKGLDAFGSQSPSHGIILENLAEDILENLENFFPLSPGFATRKESLQNLVQKTKEELEEVSKELEETQDVLLDLNSFNQEKTDRLMKHIDSHEDNPLLESFVHASLESLGVDYENHDEKGSLKINLDSLSFVSDLPLFKELENRILTFERSLFLKQASAYFASFPSKFVQTLVELATSKDQGRLSFSSLSIPGEARKVYFQVLFHLEIHGPKHLELEKFFSPETLEFYIDSKGSLQKELPNSEALRDLKSDSPYRDMLKSKKFIAILTKRLEELETQVTEWQGKMLTSISETVNKKEKEELSELAYLMKINPMYTNSDYENCKRKYEEIRKCIEESQSSLSALRVILVNP